MGLHARCGRSGILGAYNDETGVGVPGLIMSESTGDGTPLNAWRDERARGDDRAVASGTTGRCRRRQWQHACFARRSERVASLRLYDWSSSNATAWSFATQTLARPPRAAVRESVAPVPSR